MKDNWIDKMVYYVNPQAGLKRTHARYQRDKFQKLTRAYEGASKGRRTDGWKTFNTSSNIEILGALNVLRNRSRDLTRNNPTGKRAIQIIQSNTIGIGIVAQIRSLSNNEKVKTNATALWNDWAWTQACDFEGLQPFGGIQSMSTREKAEAGECIIRKRIVKPTFSNPFPIQLQLLEPDFIDTSRNELGNFGAKIIQGVEFDATGKRVAYWLYDNHPGETGISFKSQRVSADDIIHDFRPERAGQVRGIPWGASAFLKLRDLDEYADAQLIRQKIAACFTVFYSDNEMPSTLTDESAEFDQERVEPGLILDIGSGKTVTLASPPGVQGYLEFTTPTNRTIAAGYDIPYEVLMGDFSQVNFSSARMGLLQLQRDVDQWRWHQTIPNVCAKSFNWFKQGCELMGKPITDTVADWTPPRREMIDPASETGAIRDQVRAGIMTLSEAIKQQGNDPAEHFKAIAADNKTMDDLKITLDTDPRKMTKVGFAQTLDTIEALADGVNIPAKAQPAAKNPSSAKPGKG